MDNSKTFPTDTSRADLTATLEALRAVGTVLREATVAADCETGAPDGVASNEVRGALAAAVEQLACRGSELAERLQVAKPGSVSHLPGRFSGMEDVRHGS